MLAYVVVTYGTWCKSVYAQSHHEEIKPISKYRSCKGKFDSLRTIQFRGVCQSPLTTVNTYIHTCV